jgi:hypothetical protein
MEDLVRATFRGDLLKVKNQLAVYPFLLNEVDQVRSLQVPSSDFSRESMHNPPICCVK